METPEGKVKKKLINYIKDLQQAGEKIYYEPREAGGYTYRKGQPDYWMVYDGRHIEIEVKAPGGEQSAMQIKWQHIFRNLGIECYCIEGVNELKEILNKKADPA